MLAHLFFFSDFEHPQTEYCIVFKQNTYLIGQSIFKKLNGTPSEFDYEIFNPEMETQIIDTKEFSIKIF